MTPATVVGVRSAFPETVGVGTAVVPTTVLGETLALPPALMLGVSTNA